MSEASEPTEKIGHCFANKKAMAVRLEKDGQTMSKRYTKNPLLALILMASGCASTAPQSPQGGAAHYEVAAPVTKDMVTVENLLRWPLEGLAGINKVSDGIRATFNPTDRTAGLLGFTDKQFQLEDGYVLTDRDVFRGPGASVSLAPDPCFPPSRAAEIIDAEPGPVIYDRDGNDRGRIYRVIRNDVRMHVYTNSLTYRCVRSIEIYALPKLANTSISRNDVTLENMLRWPLEGKTGLDKLEAGLHQVFEDMEPLRNQQFSSVGVAYLADGYILRSTSTGPGRNRIDIDVEGWPCFPPERAMELTGAVQGIVRTDMHGGEYGKEYAVENHGIRLTFGTTPRTYQCVDSIYITPALKSNKGASL